MSNRQYPRIPVSAAARVRSGCSEIKCRVVNLSAQGMALETAREDLFARFVRVTAAFGGGSLRLDIDAIVKNEETVADKKRWGLEFFEPSPHDIALIADYVRERLGAEDLEETLQAGGSADSSAAQKPRSQVDPEVQRLYAKALESLA